MVPEPEALALSEKLLEMEIFRSNVRPTKSEILGWGPVICV